MRELVAPYFFDNGTEDEYAVLLPAKSPPPVVITDIIEKTPHILAGQAYSEKSLRKF